MLKDKKEVSLHSWGGIKNKMAIDVSSMTQTGLTVLTYIFSIGGIAIALFFAGWYGIKWKRYREFNVIWFDRDNLSAGTDKAGIFVDAKTKNKRFFLKKGNVGLDPDNVPWKMIGGGWFGGKKTVFLKRTGLKNFQFININIQGNPQTKIEVGEEDVNWAINAYERQKKVFSESTLLMLMPYFALAFVSFTILILFIQLFKNFGVLKEVAANLAIAAQATSGTTVIP